MMYLIVYCPNENMNSAKMVSAVKHHYQQWAILSENNYVIISNQTAVEIRDILELYTQRNDKLMVTHMTSPTAWLGFSKQINEWLKAAYKFDKDNQL